MPSARVQLEPVKVGYENHSMPELLRTPSGVIMLEVQGVLNLGDNALYKTELDLHTAPNASRPVLVGELDLSQSTEVGIRLQVGTNQLLRGRLEKLKMPIAVLELSTEIKALEVITHRLVFSSRPEPVQKAL